MIKTWAEIHEELFMRVPISLQFGFVDTYLIYSFAVDHPQYKRPFHFGGKDD